MIKKLGVGLLIVALAFFAFVSVQKGKIEQKATALLQEQNVQVERLAVNLLFSPSIELQKIHYALNDDYQFSADNLSLKLSWWGILTANSEVADIQLKNGVFFAGSMVKLNAINGTITPINFPLTELSSLMGLYRTGELWPHITPEVQFNLSAQTEQNDKLSLKVGRLTAMKNKMNWQDLQVALELNHRRLFNTDKLLLSTKHGFLDWLDHTYKIQTDLTINQLHFNQFVGHFKMQVGLQGHVMLQGDERARAEIAFSPLLWTLKSHQLPLQLLLDSFNIPVLVTGKVDGEVALFAEDYFPKEGEIRARITEGELNGLNLLALVSQYLPINYDNEQFNQKTNSTGFERISTHFYWKPNGLHIKQTELIHERFIARSTGNIALMNGQCDIYSEISINDSRYESLKLPVHFFGDCQSPQYKVEFDRTFRHQLKKFIKEKLR